MVVCSGNAAGIWLLIDTHTHSTSSSSWSPLSSSSAAATVPFSLTNLWCTPPPRGSDWSSWRRIHFSKGALSERFWGKDFPQWAEEQLPDMDLWHFVLGRRRPCPMYRCKSTNLILSGILKSGVKYRQVTFATWTRSFESPTDNQLTKFRVFIGLSRNFTHPLGKNFFKASRFVHP